MEEDIPLLSKQKDANSSRAVETDKRKNQFEIENGKGYQSIELSEENLTKDNANGELHQLQSVTGIVRFGALILLLYFIWIYFIPPLYEEMSQSFLPDGMKVQFSAVDSDLFLRAEDLVFADHTFPFLQGSTFEVYRSSNKCFQLKTTKNQWLAVDRTGRLTAGGLTKLDGSYFAAEMIDQSNNHIRLKLCGQKAYLALQQGSHGIFVGIQSANSISSFQNDLFQLNPITPVKGVNLGGWFIPEFWMNPTFFAKSPFGWGNSLCRFVAYENKTAETVMLNHLQTWIQEKDLQEISSLGFTSVRVPVGYWNIVEDPYHLFVPMNLSVSDYYLDWLFRTTAKYNLSILLDLHGAPKSQNGVDHSGCNFYSKFADEGNIDFTLVVITEMMRKYGHYSNFYGIELLNEPSTDLTYNDHSLLVSYYQQAYEIIRSYHPTCYIVINELYEKAYRKWANDLQEPQYYNVIMDYHLYNWQDPYTYQTAEQHIENALNWESLLEFYSIQHPIIVGEWSMSTGIFLQVGQTFVDACVQSFNQGSFGWYLWNWKIDRNQSSLFETWDVQYQLIEKGKEHGGLNPLKG